MAMLIRSDHDLPTLRIMEDPRPNASEAVFQVVRGQETPVEVTRCRVADLGLPESLQGRESVHDEALRIPESVLAALGPAVSGLGWSPIPPVGALWLELPSPRGFLYVVPWERLLAPLGRCVFRLPNHLVRPQAQRRRLEVALCSSAPRAKELFDPAWLLTDLAQQYVARTGFDVHMHLFTDVSVNELAREWVLAEGLADQVEVHDPTLSESYSRPARRTTLTSSAEISSPWLRWMIDSMHGGCLDVVHFATHGFLSGDRGAIAVASTPMLNTDRQLSRFIGSVELTAFLTQVGAWGLALSGPQHNFSDAGLRELADAVAQARPGVVMTHAVAHDPSSDQFGMALETIFGEGLGLDDPLPAMSCWVHPRFIEFPDDDQSQLHVNADGSSAFIAEATRDALASSDTQAWVASASRSLEMLQARWMPAMDEEEADPAAVSALHNVAAMLDRHVTRAYPSGGTSRGDS